MLQEKINRNPLFNLNIFLLHNVLNKYIIIFGLLIICISCVRSMNFSTPESTYNYYQKSVAEKNYDAVYKCFYLDNGGYNKENLKILVNKLFSDIHLVESKIINRKEVSPERIDLTVIDTLVFKKYDHKKKNTKVLIEFIKTEEGWKITKTTLLDSG